MIFVIHFLKSWNLGNLIRNVQSPEVLNLSLKLLEQVLDEFCYVPNSQCEVITAENTNSLIRNCSQLSRSTTGPKSTQSSQS